MVFAITMYLDKISYFENNNLMARHLREILYVRNYPSFQFIPTFFKSSLRRCSTLYITKKQGRKIDTRFLCFPSSRYTYPFPWDASIQNPEYFKLESLNLLES